MGVQKTSSKSTAKVSQKLDKKVQKSTFVKAHGDSGVSAKKGDGAVRSQQKKGGASASVHRAGVVKAVPKAKPDQKLGGGNSRLGGRLKVESTATQLNAKKTNVKSSHFSGISGHSLIRSESLSETVCREVACEGLATSGGYCRLHYVKNWKKIKRKEVILREKKLNQYIEELIVKYPDKYIEAIRQDLASDKDFAKVIYDLDLDEGVDDFDSEGVENADSLIDTIKRDFDDDGDAGF